jgi:hypothetical protein
MPKYPSHILELAKRGAEVRFRELVQEAKHLIGLFPHRRDAADKDELPIAFILAKGAGRSAKRQAPRRRKMSAAARKAISDRMKTLWVARRKAKKA